MKTVLVIGGAGYIGSALVPRLLKSGYKVRLLELFMYGRETISEVINHPNLTIIEGDFRQVHRVVEAMQGVDAVVHLGGLVGDPACSLDEALTIDINQTATKMIAEVAKRHKVERFIFASSCSVYGQGNGILTESSPQNPVSLYARSKIASEADLTPLNDDNFATVMMRFSTVYGLSGRTRFDLVVNLFSAKAIVDKEMIVMGGQQWRPFVHVEDVARSCFMALEADVEKVRGQVYNVGSSSQNFTIRGVAEEIQRYIPDAHIIENPGEVDPRDYQVSFDKIKNELGFEPEWTLSMGIQQVVDAFAAGRVTDYTATKYSNVKYLEREGLLRLGVKRA